MDRGHLWQLFLYVFEHAVVQLPGLIDVRQFFRTSVTQAPFSGGSQISAKTMDEGQFPHRKRGGGGEGGGRNRRVVCMVCMAVMTSCFGFFDLNVQWFQRVQHRGHIVFREILTARVFQSFVPEFMPLKSTTIQQ